MKERKLYAKSCKWRRNCMRKYQSAAKKSCEGEIELNEAGWLSQENILKK